MEWLQCHINRIDKFCSSLETGQRTYLHIPKSGTNDEDCDCGMEYQVHSKEISDKNNNNFKNVNGYGNYREHENRHNDRILDERIFRYHKIPDAKESRTLPVSVIVSDRSGSTSSVPSPTSSVSDSVSIEAENEKNIPDKNDPDASKKEDAKSNKSYTYKPLPMVRKSQRQFISAEKKDSLYWERRKRNNEAAKKSRESRREKEIEVSRRCKDLEKENTGMRFTIINLQERNSQLENTLKIYKEILIKNNLI